EVMTGFRLSLGGAQKLYGVRPDMTTMGKIIGGGLPVGAYGGRKEIMNCVAPEGPAYQAGTLSGNPVAMAAGIATLKILREEDPYEGLSLQTQTLTNGLKEIAEKYKTPLTVERAGSMWTPFFSPGPIHSPDDARKADAEKFKKFFHGMLKNGVMLPPSPFEAAFVSTAHGKKEIQKTLETAEKVLGNF
ncbi:MAG: aminotransferase class III-fold pyridoxal phosphate-dependent enzyme, partial [bacterium]|nr:aminotransferase class III-fold pyridoxal phosphate-dependent enzyme [bacterium]